MKLQKHLQMIFKMERMLKAQVRMMGLDQNIGSIPMKLTGIEPAMTQKEDGKTFKYPETLELSFYNWSTTHYSLRTKDGGWIRSGRNMNTTKPETTYQVYRAQLKELKAFAAKLKPSNVVEFKPRVS